MKKTDDPEMNEAQRMHCKYCQQVFSTKWWPQWCTGRCPRCSNGDITTWKSYREYNLALAGIKEQPRMPQNIIVLKRGRGRPPKTKD